MRKASSYYVTKALKKHLFPVLQGKRFQNIRNRYAYRYEPEVTSIFFYRCLGAYLSDRTGFPSLSLTAEVGVDWPDVPNPFTIGAPVDPDDFDKEDGNPVPGMSVHESLNCIDMSIQHRRNISHEPERVRTYIWWVEPDGSNLELVVQDLTVAVTDQGFPFLDSFSTYQRSLDTLLANEPTPGQLWDAYCIARKIGADDTVASLLPEVKKYWSKPLRLLA